MPEDLPISKPPEALRTAAEIEQEENERYEAWIAEHPMIEDVQYSPEVCAVNVEVCESMMRSFERRYDLDALRAITHFDSREERESSPRQDALWALASIFKLLKALGRQKAFASEDRAALGPRYEVLSQAVGNITVDKDGKIFDVVVHDRPTPFPN